MCVWKEQVPSGDQQGVPAVFSRFGHTHARPYGLFQTLALKFLSFSRLRQMLPNRQGECLLGHLLFSFGFFFPL
jgi:hypothetical protein